jgi:hypothetical protein
MTTIIDAPPLADLIADIGLRRILLRQFADKNICILRSVATRGEVSALVAYLSGVGRNSLPNWQAILRKCPNFHRVSHWDERSYVKACFHQFSFFPWNQDVFNLFKRFREVFVLRNLLSGAEPGAYLGYEPDDDCIARLSFQFYPKGIGGMNEHIDPVGSHQAVVPLLMMSELGVDFCEGGIFARAADGRQIFIEHNTKPGDVVLFSAEMPHGVATIDPTAEPDWPSFEGRWMAIFAVNKLATNNRVREAVDLAAAS